jgi:hypothetical protein
MKKDSLSSDILEDQCGPTELVILHQTPLTRIICTKVIASGQILELSRVVFMEPGIKAFPHIHKTIGAGQSMGKAFREQGIEFIRNVNYVYHADMPVNFSERFMNSSPATVVSVSIFVGRDRVHYADILETYSPTVSWPDPSAKPSNEQLRALQAFDNLLQSIEKSA